MIRNIRPVLLCLCVLTVVYAVAQDEPKLVKINDSISMAMMASNVYLVTTPDGNVVIDTAPAKQAATAKQLLSTVSHAPVKFIILTHGHADHIGGIDLWKEAGTQVIAQRNYFELVNYVSRLEGFLFSPQCCRLQPYPSTRRPVGRQFRGKDRSHHFVRREVRVHLGGCEV